MGRWRLGRLLLAAAAAVLVMTGPAAAAPSVTVRGTEVAWTDAVPYLDGGRTMAPVRAVAEALGLTVQWDEANRRVDLRREYGADSSLYRAELQTGQWEYLAVRELHLWIGSPSYEVTNVYAVQDGRTVTQSRTGSHTGELDAPAVIRGGRTYAPVRYIAEAFGFDVIWDSGTVRIVSSLTADWSYAWSIDEDGGTLVLALHSPVNVASAEITSVSVTPAGGRAEPLDAAAAGSQGEARIRQAIGSDALLLDAVAAEYPFQAGGSYTIAFTAELHKANGASQAVSDTFLVQLPS